MKTIYIHIGPHKTGTTTIQNTLFINRKVLLSNDTLIPGAGKRNENSAAHHNLAWELLAAIVYRSEYGKWEDLLTELKNCRQKNIIISSEEFSRLELAHIEQIRAYLKDYQVKIVSYVRSQDQFLQSFWSQKLKMGEHINFFDDFKDWLEENDYYFANVDFAKFLGLWADIFGKEHMIVRVLERGQLEGTLFHDFISACGIPWSKVYQEPDDKNISPGIKILVLMQEFKKKLKGEMDPACRADYFMYMSNYASMNGWDIKKANLVDAGLHHKIMDRYRDSNRTVARDYFGREELFLEPYNEKEITRFSLEEFQPGELLDIFSFAIGKMFGKNEEKMDAEELERQYQKVKDELESIHASRGWKVLQKLRRIKKKLRSGK